MTALRIHFNDAQLAHVMHSLSPEIWQGPVGQLVHEASDLAVHEAQSNARDLGGLPATIGAQVQPMGATVSTEHAGALALEGGRRVGAQLPPPDALLRYGTDTFPMARAISSRGIRGRFFMRKAKETVERDLPQMAAKTLEEIGRSWEAE